MSIGISSANLAIKWLGLLKGAAFTAPAGAYLKLHIGDPGSAGANNAAAGDTTRKAITFATPTTTGTSTSMAMNGTLPVWTDVATNETVTNLSQWDTVSAGLFLLSSALTTPQAWSNGLTFTLQNYVITIGVVAV